MTAPAEQEWLADLGELTGPVTHEVNNFLNCLLLHLAVLDQQAPDNVRVELTEIRRQGLEISKMLGKLQEYQNARHSERETVDLNGVVRKTVQELGSATGGANRSIQQRRIAQDQGPASDLSMLDGTQPALDLTTDRLAVVGHPSHLKRLCTFLIRNALAAAKVNGGSVTIRTERAPDKALLRVEDTGPEVPPSKLAEIFEPHLTCREGTNSLELAACLSLVRRFEGKICAEARAGVGLRIDVSLPLASCLPPIRPDRRAEDP